MFKYERYDYVPYDYDVQRSELAWHRYFFEIAKAVATKSKDPSSKIGVVIVGPEWQILSTGFNGFPRGIDEGIPLRWEKKYSWIVHAEANAICNAARHGVELRDSTMYLYGFGPPTVPCRNCAKLIIQTGMITVVGTAYKESDPSWHKNLLFAKDMLNEAGVRTVEYYDKSCVDDSSNVSTPTPPNLCAD